MIRKVRRKFTVSAMAAMSFVTLLLIAVINLANFYYSSVRADTVLEELNRDSDPSGDLMHGGDRRDVSAQYGSLFFSIFADENGDFRVLRNGSSFLDDEEAAALAEDILQTGKSSGYIDEYRYLIPSDIPDDLKEEGGRQILLLDCSTEFYSIRSLLLISVLIGIGGLFLVFFFVWRMAGKAVQPLQESMDKQKRFITDAGHELKTPISVIGTNMDVMEMDFPGNEWIASTKRQVRSLKKLVQQLISLSRLEEGQEVPRESFSLSDCTSECVGAYEMIAGREHKKMTVSIASGISVNACEDQVRQILTILCDNAMKYAESEIDITLARAGKSAVFETRNDWAEDVKKEDLDKLLERFYRSDSSRNRDSKKSGYGLGLSIAQAAAAQNGGKLEVREESDGKIAFRFLLPAS